MQKLFEIYFKSKKDEIYFRSKKTGLAIRTYSLVMSQSLYQNRLFLKSNKEEFKNSNFRYTLTRRNDLRLISAFNKKIMFRNGSFLKYALLCSSGLQSVTNFDDYIDILIRRRRSGLFVDRHFRAIPPFDDDGKRLDIDSINDKVFRDNQELAQIFTIRKKSSKELAGSRKIFSLGDCNTDQIGRLREYLDTK